MAACAGLQLRSRRRFNLKVAATTEERQLSALGGKIAERNDLQF